MLLLVVSAVRGWVVWLFRGGGLERWLQIVWQKNWGGDCSDGQVCFVFHFERSGLFSVLATAGFCVLWLYWIWLAAGKQRAKEAEAGPTGAAAPTNNWLTQQTHQAD